MVVPLIIVLMLLIISDFRSRFVYVWQIALFFVVQLIYCYLTFDGGYTLLQNMIANSVFLLFLSACVWIYVRFRFREKSQLIGWGDVLFVFALTPYFALPKFLWFMILAMVLSLGGWAVLYLRGRRTKEIPLVSTVGICYGVLLIYDNVMSRW